MQPFRKLLIVSAVSVGMLLPQQLSWACGPDPALPEDFRVSLFDPAVYDKDVQFSPYYFSLNTYYKEDEPTCLAADIESDENYSEWQQQLEKTPFSRRDFHKAVREYSYRIVADSSNELRKSNSFIAALLHRGNGAYFNYFKLAKSTEGFNGVEASSNAWGLDSYLQVSDSLLHHITYELKHAQNSFIRQRAAYLLCRLFFYNHDAKNLQLVYNTYLNRKDVHSWVKEAARYYSITMLYSSDTSFSKEYCRALTSIIDKSKDKRLPAIRQLLQQPQQRVLSLLPTTHEKATAIAAYAMRNVGFGLADMKRIYSLEPNNQFLPLLLNREISKLEDWLLTPAVTEYGSSAIRSGYWDWGEDTASNKIKDNLARDRQYASRVIAFAKQINRNHRYDASLCHLYFLSRNWKAAELYCNQVLTHTSKPSALHTQAQIDHAIIRLQKEKRVSPSLQNEIYFLLTALDEKERRDKQQQVRSLNDYFYTYNSGYTLKDNLLLYLGRTAFSLHDVVNASLLLSGTMKPWGEYRTGADKNIYFLLYEHGREGDFNRLISIVRKKQKTKYEAYFMNHKVDTYGNYTFNDVYRSYYKDHIISYWDVHKLLDMQGTYFIKEDNLAKAYEAFRQIPDTFWTSKEYVYRDYLTGNPFKLDLGNTHEYGSRNAGHVNNPNKTQFVQKLIALKNKAQATRDKEEKARLYYTIGNAYYSMGFNGKFWMMSKLWWETDEMAYLQNQPLSAFDMNYYTAARAKPYYRQAMQLTGNPKKAAFYCMYLTHCENKRKELVSYLLYAKHHTTHWYYDYDYKQNPYLYTSLLKRRSGSYSFYKEIITECPVYDDFRSKIERGL